MENDKGDSCNIFILGKTDVGKSSLLNYLFDSKGVERVYVGKEEPITGQGFYEYESQLNGRPVNIYESWGIEAGKTDEWKKLLAEEMEKHDVKQEIVAIFCINAGSHRVEDFEIKMIKQLQEARLKVVVALTKADTLSKDKCQELRDVIEEGCGRIPVIEVCGSSEEGRDGKLSEKFGDKELIKIIENDKEYSCNIAILGKTGVGKSSLLNYLFGVEHAEVGTGKPVTGQGFYEYENEFHGRPARIYDSWGIEAGKTDEWEKLLAEEMKKHGVRQEIQEWFHAAIFCINAGSDRVENFEIKMIKQLQEAKLKVVVVLTKADMVSKAKCQKLRDVIEEDCVTTPVIEVCGSSEEGRDGKPSEKFGDEKLIEAVLVNWRKMLCDRLPDRIVDLLKEEVKKLRDSGADINDASQWFYSEPLEIEESRAFTLQGGIQYATKEGMESFKKEMGSSLRVEPISLKQIFFGKTADRRSTQQEKDWPMEFPNCQQFIEIIATELKKAQKSSSALLGAIDEQKIRKVSGTFTSLWDEWSDIYDVGGFFSAVGRTLKATFTLGASEKRAREKARERAVQNAWDAWLKDIEEKDRKEVERIVQKIFGDKAQKKPKDKSLDKGKK